MKNKKSEEKIFNLKSWIISFREAQTDLTTSTFVPQLWIYINVKLNLKRSNGTMYPTAPTNRHPVSTRIFCNWNKIPTENYSHWFHVMSGAVSGLRGQWTLVCQDKMTYEISQNLLNNISDNRLARVVVQESDERNSLEFHEKKMMDSYASESECASIQLDRALKQHSRRLSTKWLW